MSEERGCLGRAFRIGCGFALCLVLTAGAVALYGLWTAPAEVPELTTEERATATSKLAGVERSLRSGRPFETQFSEAELTLLAQQYLNREGIRGDVSVTLPEDDLQLSFRTTVEQLERFVKLDQLESWMGSNVRGAYRVHPLMRGWRGRRAGPRWGHATGGTSRGARPRAPGQSVVSRWIRRLCR